MLYKKLIAILLMITLLLSSSIIGSALSKFSDVENNHWAKEYIEKMSEKGIISGFWDDVNLRFNFYPERAVTKVQAIKMIYETLKAAGKLQSTASLADKHKETLTTNGIPSWAHEAAAYALEYSIVHPDELKLFMEGGLEKEARRVDVAVFLGKALNMPLAPWPVLTFIDAEDIVDSAERYVDLLVKKGIISGDGNNRFNPNHPVTRAQMAKMCAVAYDLLEEEDETIPVQQPQETNTAQPEHETKAGILEYVAEDTDMIIVKFDDETELKPYTVSSDVEIKINDTSRTIRSLEKGQRVILTFDGDTLIKIEVDDTVTDFEGTITAIINLNDYYLITVKDKEDGDHKRTFKADEDTKIELDGEEADITELEKGHLVRLEIDDDFAAEIIAETSVKTYDGILESGVLFKEQPVIQVKLNHEDEIVEFPIDDRAKIEKNGKRSDLEDLVRGDFVNITVENDLVTKIYATSIKSKDEGIIKAITIGTPSRITILNDDDEENTYDVAADADIEIDGDDATIYDLRINYYVEVRIESNTITDLEAESKEQITQFNGEIDKIYEDPDILVVKYKGLSSTENETISVYITRSTRFSSTRSSRSMDFDDLDEGDSVFILGEYDGDLFKAIQVIRVDH